MMHQTRRAHLATLAACLATTSTATADEPNDYIGTWSAVMDDGTLRIRVRIHIDSQISARLNIIDQGNFEGTTANVDLGDDGVTLEFKDVGETLTGKLVDANTLRLASSAFGMSFDFSRGDMWPPTLLTAERLSQTRRDCGAPAIGVAYARAEGVITTLVDGVRASDDTVPVTADDRWLLASVSKSMTATLVARLVEAGGISWDTTIADLLGKAIPGMQEIYKRATFRHLLSHHAGLQPNISAADTGTFSSFALADARSERLRYAALALGQTPTSAPGERALYANNGYVIVGAMLEARYAQRWEDLIKDHVFRPLGISSFGFGPPGTPGQLDQPLGHRRQRETGKLVPGRPGAGVQIDNIYALGPAGRVHLSLADLITYLRAHLRRSENVLSSASWRTLHTPPFTPGRAMGWFVADNGQLYHTGSTPWWDAYAGIDHTRGVVAAVVTNTNTPLTAGAARGLYLDAMLTAAS